MRVSLVSCALLLIFQKHVLAGRGAEELTCAPAETVILGPEQVPLENDCTQCIGATGDCTADGVEVVRAFKVLTIRLLVVRWCSGCY